MVLQEGMPLTDERWRAITQNDSSYDDVFIYAVTSTGICCRPSCQSRDPKKENVRIFNDVDEAVAAGFRPCKRCKPGGIRLPDEEWVFSHSAFVGNISRYVSWKSLSPTTHL